MLPMLDETKLREKIGQIVTERNKVLRVLYDLAPINWKDVFEQYRDFGRRMAPFVDDTTFLLLQYAREGKRVPRCDR